MSRIARSWGVMVRRGVEEVEPMVEVGGRWGGGRRGEVGGALVGVGALELGDVDGERHRVGCGAWRMHGGSEGLCVGMGRGGVLRWCTGFECTETK